MKSLSTKVFTLLVLIMLLASFIPLQRASAQATSVTFVVDSFADIKDHTSNGQCSTGFPINGPCTLRAAITEALSWVKDYDVTIKLPTGTYSLTIPPGTYNASPAEGNLNIVPPLTLHTIHITAADQSKPAPVIDAGGITDGIFQLGSMARVIMTHLELMGGVVIHNVTSTSWGGAINNEGYLELNDVDLYLNSAVCADFSLNCLTYGGAIFNTGDLYIKDSRIYFNQATSGSVIYSDSSGTVDIQRTKIFSNTTVQSAVDIGTGATVNIVNTSFTNNISSSGPNIALQVACCATVSVSSSTFVNPVRGVSIALGAYNPPRPNIAIYSTILNSAGGNCDNYQSFWLSNGNNIASDNSCSFMTMQGDLLNTDPMVAVIPTLGGYFPDHVPLPGSPAINRNPGNCVWAGAPLLSDVLGVPRGDGRCDTGAFERNFPAYLPAVRR